MSLPKKIIILLLFQITALVTLFSKQPNTKNYKQAVNICAIAIPVANVYVANYEFLYKGNHGLGTRLEYLPLEDKDTSTVAKGIGVILDYRYHILPQLDSIFIGPYARYRYIEGSGLANSESYSFKVPELNLGLNAGYRWIHKKSGFNVGLSIGYGYSWTNTELSSNSENVKEHYNKFKDINSGTQNFLEAPFLGEVSFGYSW